MAPLKRLLFESVNYKRKTLFEKAPLQSAAQWHKFVKLVNLHQNGGHIGVELRAIAKEYSFTKMDVPSFLTRNGTNEFLTKQKSLFDVLDFVEKEKKVSTAECDEYIEVKQKSNKRIRKETKLFRGKESLFKEPVELPARFRRSHRIPDYQRNPHKWVKYSLADITQNDMSNESNTAAALSFLKELKSHKKQSETIKADTKEPENKCTPPRTHQFSIHKIPKDPIIEQERDSHKPVFKSSKLIMPEYVIGQARKEPKVPKKKLSSKEKGKEIFLNHIHEYEDE